MSGIGLSVTSALHVAQLRHRVGFRLHDESERRAALWNVIRWKIWWFMTHTMIPQYGWSGKHSDEPGGALSLRISSPPPPQREPHRVPPPRRRRSCKTIKAGTGEAWRRILSGSPCVSLLWMWYHRRESLTLNKFSDKGPSRCYGHNSRIPLT